VVISLTPTITGDHMKIEIDLNDLGFDYDEEGDKGRVRTIQEAVVAQAANQIIATSGWDYRQQVNAVVHEEAGKVIALRVDLALKGQIQRTSEWGEPVGAPVTILDIVREELGKFLGGKTVRDRFANGSDNKPQNLAEMVARTVADLLRSEFSTEIRKVRAEVIDQLRTKALKAAADALVSGK
jgi:hypothetical protein